MSRYQEIAFIKHQERFNFRTVEHKDVFAYRDLPGKGIQQEIQKICFWILRKLKCFYREPIKDVELVKVPVDSDQFMYKIIEQTHVLDGFWHMRPRKILVGSEDYSEIMSCTIPMQGFHFQSEYYIREGGRRQIYGLEVQVIPWMRGILVMPNEER